MRSLKIVASMGMLGFALLGGTRASEREGGANGATPDPPATQAIPNEPVAPNDAGSTKPKPPERGKAKPERPDHPSREIADAARQLAEEAKQARMDFLKQQQKLKNQLRQDIEAERDQIRAMLKENRPAPPLSPQLDARQDFRQRLAELKEKLHEHKEALEQASSEAKEKKKRKDGDP